MARPVKIISHATVKHALEAEAPDGTGHRLVVFVLGKDEVLEERFTSSHGRYHGGPATINVHRYASGGVDVHVTEKGG